MPEPLPPLCCIAVEELGRQPRRKGGTRGKRGDSRRQVRVSEESRDDEGHVTLTCSSDTQDEDEDEDDIETVEEEAEAVGGWLTKRSTLMKRRGGVEAMRRWWWCWS